MATSLSANQAGLQNQVLLQAQESADHTENNGSRYGANAHEGRRKSLDELAKMKKEEKPHEAFLNGPGSNYLDRIVDQSRTAIGDMDKSIQGALAELKKEPGNVGLMIDLQLQVGKRSLMITTTTSTLKTAKEDAAGVARAI